MKLAFISALFVLLPSCADSTPRGPAGHWSGMAGPSEDRREMAVTLMSQDTLAGTIDLPSAGIVAEKLSGISADGDRLRFVLETDLGPVAFEARRSADRLSGTMAFGDKSFPFELAATPPAAPSRNEEVRFASGAIPLVGTLVLPAKEGPYPAVVFVPPSGDQPRLGIGDRARVEAYRSAGIAVLVYDKRGSGQSGGDPRRIGFSELADDALAAVRWLRGRREIRADAVGLDGRSQGAWISELAASRSNEIGFIVAQVGGGVAPWRQELFRVGAEMRARGLPPEAIERAQAFFTLHYAVARGDSAWDRYASRREALRNEPWWEIKRAWTSAEQAHLSWDRIAGFDPAPVIAATRCPMLVVLGSDDRSTPTDETAQALRAAHRQTGAPPIDVRVLEGADHAMLTYPASGLPRLPEGYPALVPAWVKAAVGSRPATGGR